MTDTAKLKAILKRSGYKLNFVADKLGLTYYGFAKKLNNGSEFKAGEIQALCDLLRIRAEDRDSIFFCRKCR